MKAVEVNAIVAEAVEYLQRAQPGRPSVERAENRRKANELMAKLSRRDLQKISDELVNLLGIFA